MIISISVPAVIFIGILVLGFIKRDVIKDFGSGLSRKRQVSGSPDVQRNGTNFHTIQPMPTAPGFDENQEVSKTEYPPSYESICDNQNRYWRK